MSPTPSKPRKPSRSVPRSLVCSTLAIVLAAVPSLPVLAAAPSKSGKAKKAKTSETTVTEAPKEEAAPASEVPASPDGDPEALSAAAVERFEAKDYDGAVALFEQAYAADPNPNYLFNIGRVYEEKGDLENAVVYYQRFVGEPGVDIESRQSATDRLKVLREALAQLEAEEEPKDEPKDEGTEPVVDQPPVTDEDDERAAKRKKALRITGYSLMGVGGVGLILGGVFGGLAQRSVKDADADPFVDRQEAFRDRARTQARVADAMFITGGVLAATGLVLVLATLGRKKAAGSDVSRKAMWSPVVGPQHVGVGWRF
jgi:tetratricopeptide (TPR) repeat protein